MIEKLPLISPEIRVKLEAARVARLATLDAERSPHMVPICFVCDGSVFYSAIDRKPKRVAANSLARLKNIAQTPRVALLVDHYDEDWTRLGWVMVHGRAEILADGGEHDAAQALLRSRYPQLAPMHIAGQAVIAVRITRSVSWGDLSATPLKLDPIP